MQAELVHADALAGSSARARTRSWLGQLAGLLLLIATVHYVEPSALVARLSRLKTGFIAFGASLVLPQLYCLALRWRLTAAQLGFAMPQRHALREYSLSMLLNLLLPFGIAGDALRMLRLAPRPLPTPQPTASLAALGGAARSTKPHQPSTALDRMRRGLVQDAQGQPIGPEQGHVLDAAPHAHSQRAMFSPQPPSAAAAALSDGALLSLIPHQQPTARALDAAALARSDRAMSCHQPPTAAAHETDVPGRGERQGRVSTLARGSFETAGAARTQRFGIGRAFQSVVLERMLGQVVVIVWAGAALPLWFGRAGVWLSLTLLAALALLVLLIQRISITSRAPRSMPMRALLELALALRGLLASRRYLSAQLALSSVITLSIAAQLFCALGALGLSLSAAQASQVFPLMLLSMSLPLAFAGFGPREAVTAELYEVLHLSAADGAAFALAFGVILICTSLPCLLLVLLLSEGDEP